ncbi:hypothetical protein ACGFX4_12335 [Kitasatospora sp. NPDC048365]|uniref:hypothetical protein n=1 Tax=Kitasatospora sp. NPDC048365 TaxID=3364050 RepID=UPI003716414E
MFGSRKRKEQKSAQWQELVERAADQALRARAMFDEPQAAIAEVREELGSLYARRVGAPKAAIEAIAADADEARESMDSILGGFDDTHAENVAEQHDDPEVLQALVDYYVQLGEVLVDAIDSYLPFVDTYRELLEQARAAVERVAPVRARVHEALAAAEPEVEAKGGHAARARITGIVERLAALDAGAVVPTEDRTLSARYRELDLELAELRDSL